MQNNNFQIKVLTSHIKNTLTFLQKVYRRYHGVTDCAVGFAPVCSYPLICKQP